MQELGGPDLGKIDLIFVIRYCLLSGGAKCEANVQMRTVSGLILLAGLQDAQIPMRYLHLFMFNTNVLYS